MKRLYLDIDGVLLGKTNDRVTLAKGAEEFVDYALEHYECFWLTSHCRGDVATALSYLAPYCSDGLIEKLKRIQPTQFSTWKTEAIDFSCDFIWIDDYLFNAEINVLKENRKLSSWIKVNTYTDDNALHDCFELLQQGIVQEVLKTKF